MQRNKDNDLKIFTWNVRTLNEPGNIRKLCDILAQYNADITAIQEVRWTGHGIIQKTNYNMYYSCHRTRHEFGTAFIVNNKVKHLVIDFKPINPRMSCLRIRGKFFNISLINVHAPTEDKEDEEKDEFYDELERAYDSCPRSDIKIVIGDLNAKIGREDIYLPHIGKYSLHNNTNSNGHRAVTFAAAKNMIVGSTCFLHKKYIWELGPRPMD